VTEVTTESVNRALEDLTRDVKEALTSAFKQLIMDCPIWAEGRLLTVDASEQQGHGSTVEIRVRHGLGRTPSGRFLILERWPRRPTALVTHDGDMWLDLIQGETAWDSEWAYFYATTHACRTETKFLLILLP
jgi:hypothetical protein